MDGIERVYVVVDGSTGDIVAPASVCRELKQQYPGLEVYGVFDQAARDLLLHLGFGEEIERGQIRFADINYAELLAAVDLGGQVRGMISFLTTVSTTLNRSVPRMLDGWAALLEELQASDNLRANQSIIIGNDVGATWLTQTISLFLPGLLPQRFYSINAHPWTPGEGEFEYHPSPHFVRTNKLPPATINRIFRFTVNQMYASLGENYARDYAMSRGMDPARIMHFSDLIDQIHRHYAFDVLTLSEEECVRQQTLEQPASIGGYAFDEQIILADESLANFLHQARQEHCKVVTIALGSMTGTPANQRVVLERIMIPLLKRDDCRIVLVDGYSHSNGTSYPRDRVYVMSYENYLPLFSQSDLLIISAATGALHYAIATGCPCISIPTLPDQTTNAVWAEQKGISPGYVPYFKLLNGNRSVDAYLAQMTDRALDHGPYRSEALRLAEQVERNGLQHAVDFVLSRL